MMRNIKYILITCFLFLSITGVAQKEIRGANRDRVKADKIAYLTEKLDLTSKEAEKFWPVYNEISSKIDSLRNEIRKSTLRKIKAAGGLEMISDKASYDILSWNREIQKQLLLHEEQLEKQLQKILSYRKILQLHIAEKEFKKELFKKLKERRKGLKGNR